MLASFPLAHTEVVTSLTFSPHTGTTLCSTSGDDSAALWDIRAGTNMTHLQGFHTGPVNHSLFLPNDVNALLTASDDRSIALWDLRRAAAPLARLTGFHDGVNKMTLLPSSVYPSCGLPTTGAASTNYLLASACDDGRVYVHALLPLSPGELANVPATVSTTVATAATNSSTATTDVSALAASLPSAGALVDSFWASTSTVNDIIETPNPRVVMTASEDGALRTWRLLFDVNASTDDRLLCSLDEFENPVNHVVMVPQGWMTDTETYARSLASPGAAAAGGRGGYTTTQGGSNGDEDDRHDGDNATGAGDASENGAGTVNEEALGDDRRLAAALRVERAEEERQGRRRWALAACSEFIFGVDLSVADGAFGDGARSFVGHGDYVRGLEFTRAGTLLTVSDDGTAMEWNLTNGEPIRQVKLHEGLVMASAVSTAGDAFASGTDRGEIRVWRLPFQTERLDGR